MKPSELKEVLLVGGMTRMPRVQDAVRRFFGKEPSKGVHPDEVVALGAAVQAAALTQAESDVLLLDVTPQSLGVAVAGGYTRVLIPKNTTVPTSVNEDFATSKDGQTVVKIIVLQGEDQLASKNEILGEFILTGLRPAPRGAVTIEVAFDISAEGIVSVSGKDRETGQKQSITVSASGGLTPDELQKILAEHAPITPDHEPALPQAVNADPQLTGLRDRVNTMLRDLEELMPQAKPALEKSQFGADALQKAERALARGHGAVDGTDLEALNAVVQELERTTNLFRGLAKSRTAGNG